CPEPPHERILYRVHEDAVGDDGALAQGSVLRYRCGAGYASSGPISVWNVTCTRSYDGVLHWVLPDHDCRLVTCEPLENLANGFVETEGNEYGSTARYQCERGFRLRGEAERKVHEDAVGDDGALAQGSVLRYRCGAGYASSGPISVWSVTCTRSYDGVLHWVLPDHDCRPISCGHPGDVRHGRLLGTVFSFPIV
ncbi:c4b-binding protein beta chain, putative, partial [Ixodes scapularis]